MWTVNDGVGESKQPDCTVSTGGQFMSVRAGSLNKRDPLCDAVFACVVSPVSTSQRVM